MGSCITCALLIQTQMPKCIYRPGISHSTFSSCFRRAQLSQESCFKSSSPVWMPQTSYWPQSCRGHLSLVSWPVILISTVCHGRLYIKGGHVGSGFINFPVPYSEIDRSYTIQSQSLLMLTMNFQLQQLNLFFPCIWHCQLFLGSLHALVSHTSFFIYIHVWVM